MATRNEYRLDFESETGDDGTSLEISANEPGGELAIWISAPPNGHGDHELFLHLNRNEALEMKAILGVLTVAATEEEAGIVGGGP